MSKTCTRADCDRGTYGEFCLQHKPRKSIQTKGASKTQTAKKIRKRISRLGKYGDIWKQTRQRWLLENSAYVPCHYCGIGLKPETLTLDHKIPRSRAPELRYKVSNLVPCCFTCNGLKGSVDHDTYPHTCHG